MQAIYHASRYLLTILFIGYAVFANVAFLQKIDTLSFGEIGEVLKGSAAVEIDSVYKDSLPHRAPSIGLVGAARYLAMGDGRTGVMVGSDGWLFTEEEARPMAGAMSEAIAPILAVRDRLAARGITLVMLPVPAKLDVARDHAGSADLAQSIAGRYDSFVQDLRDAQVSVVDTRAALQAMSPDQQAFFATDTHWTADGAAVVAGAVARARVVPMGSTEFGVEEEAHKSFAGDLVSYVTTEAFAPLIGLPKETVVPYQAVEAAGLGDLFGDSAAQVALVGTSYSANPDWSFAEALKLALHQDVLNYAEQGQGPARPMLAYLDGDDLRDAPPQVVLWEFPVRYLADPDIWDAATNLMVASNDL